MHFIVDYESKINYRIRSLAHRGASSRDDPEGGARRGVLRRRLVTACPGRPGKPPARHYDLAARSSLNGSGSCRRRKRGPGAKTATVERREASVPRHGTQGASLGAWPAALRAGPTGVPPSTRTFLGAPPTPRFGVSEAQLQTPGADMRRGNARGCLTS